MGGPLLFLISPWEKEFNCSWLWILQMLVFWRGLARMYSSLIFRMLFWTALLALRVPLWWKFPNLWTQALFIFRSLWHYTGAVAHAMRDLLKHLVNLKVGGKNMLIKSGSSQSWAMTYHVHLANDISGPLEIRFCITGPPPSPLPLPPYYKNCWDPVSSAIYLIYYSHFISVINLIACEKAPRGKSRACLQVI